MTKIRCTDCEHYVASVQRCIEHKAAIRQPRRLRVCASFSGPRSLDEIHAALADAGLSRYVLDLRDTPEGRALRLRHNVPERERFSIYRIAGLKVREPERIHLPSKSASTQASPSAQPSRRAA